tara:strand:- start:5625 stop:6146 length:522 start_codon:yes stop_codon:yes gene_type:complete
MISLLKLISITTLICFTITSCGNKFGDARNNPVNAQERARKNIEEGKGVSLGSILNKRGTNYEFSSSNPMWRASLELLDFLPLSTVDYSGGVIVSDWYSDNTKSNESIKISVRFLSNEVRSNSLKIIIHKKKCSTTQNCSTTLQKNSKIIDELRRSILAKAAIFERENKKKKK